AIEIDGAFRALIDDAKGNRTESMHHLKTMVEAYIYFHFVLDDASDARARLVLSDAWDKKAQFYEANPDRWSRADAVRWRRTAGELRDGINEHVPPRPSIALRASRRISETSLNFMPEPGKARPARPESVAAQTALHYGCAVAIEALRAVVHSNTAGLTAPVDAFEEQLRIISGTRQYAPVGHAANVLSVSPQTRSKRWVPRQDDKEGNMTYHNVPANTDQIIYRNDSPSPLLVTIQIQTFD